MRTYNQALDRAKRRAKAADDVRFVLYVPWDQLYGPWTVATDEDLDTYYHGISRDAIKAEVHSDGTVDTD